LKKRRTGNGPALFLCPADMRPARASAAGDLNSCQQLPTKSVKIETKARFFIRHDRVPCPMLPFNKAKFKIRTTFA
jgi:hypothetical protein